VAIVDDNFIGNPRKLKAELLPALIRWSRQHHRPFDFEAQVSVELADDDALMALMVQAGLDSVFVGIESIYDESLEECGKAQNRGRDALEDVRRMHRAGLRVKSGFILGFDHDPPDIFERLFRFVQASGIVNAMVGPLQALPGTRLWSRMQNEGRLLTDAASGTLLGGSTLSFAPAMGQDALMRGYRDVIRKLYGVRACNERIRTFLQDFRPRRSRLRFSLRNLLAFGNSLIRLGVADRERWQFWKLFGWTLIHRPRMLPTIVMLAAYGLNHRKYIANCLNSPP
jgi:radical SAM superfamily enzyme YgiQ (UPF0313 family)